MPALSEGGNIRYFIMAFSIVVFIFMYVWQNVGMMKLRLEISRSLQEETQLMKMNDRLRYEMERYRRMEVIERFAEQTGMKEITPGDFETIYIK